MPHSMRWSMCAHEIASGAELSIRGYKNWLPLLYIQTVKWIFPSWPAQAGDQRYVSENIFFFAQARAIIYVFWD